MGKKRSFIKDDSGIAYSLFIIMVAIVFFAITYIMLAHGINEVVPTWRSEMDACGIPLSENTIDTLNFQLTLFKMLPFFVAFSVLFLYSIVRALLKKRTEGGS